MNRKSVPEEKRAYIIQHHDEGIVTETYKYRCEGYRVVTVTKTQRERASFTSENPKHLSGYAKSCVPKDDLSRYFSNWTVGYSNLTVLSLSERFADEHIIDIARCSEIIDKVEVVRKDSVEVLDV